MQLAARSLKTELTLGEEVTFASLIPLALSGAFPRYDATFIASRGVMGTLRNHYYPPLFRTHNTPPPSLSRVPPRPSPPRRTALFLAAGAAVRARVSLAERHGAGAGARDLLMMSPGSRQAALPRGFEWNLRCQTNHSTRPSVYSMSDQSESVCCTACTRVRAFFQNNSNCLDGRQTAVSE